jgi:hypothetical protein
MLYATIRALVSLPSVAPFGCAQGRLYRPRWRWYYTHSCCCLKALNPKELQGLFFIDPPTFLQLSQIKEVVATTRQYVFNQGKAIPIGDKRQSG